MKRILKFNESSGSEEMTFEIFKNIMNDLMDDFYYDYEFQIDEDGIFVCLISMNGTDKDEEPVLDIKKFIEDNLPDDIDREPLDQISKYFSKNLRYNRDLLYELKKDRIEKKIKEHEYFIKFLDSLFSLCRTRISEYKGELMIGKTYGGDFNFLAGDFLISIFYDPND